MNNVNILINYFICNVLLIYSKIMIYMDEILCTLFLEYKKSIFMIYYSDFNHSMINLIWYAVA